MNFQIEYLRELITAGAGALVAVFTMLFTQRRADREVVLEAEAEEDAMTRQERREMWSLLAGRVEKLETRLDEVHAAQIDCERRAASYQSKIKHLEETVTKAMKQ